MTELVGAAFCLIAILENFFLYFGKFQVHLNKKNAQEFWDRQPVKEETESWK